jgi:hypothetical protein
VRRCARLIGTAALLVALLQAGAARGGLSHLPVLRDAAAGRASSSDRKGGNADAWAFNPGQTRELANIEGPGAITHLWFTIAARDPGYYRKIVLRIYWDGERSPSVECPIGDFFGLGHGQYYRYSCAPIQIGDRGGLNCYWRMPFERSARIMVTNESSLPMGMYFYVDYERYPAGKQDMRGVGYFHAQYRQGRPPQKGADYTILDARGKGVYVGCNFTIQLGSPGWWGEGDDKIYVDGAKEPAIWGTGSEDYFGGAWGFPNTAYANLYTGVPLNGFYETGAITNCYRYHIEDPIPFQKAIRVDIEHRAGDYISTVAYWYQTEPHAPFPPLPPVLDRLIEEQRNAYVEFAAAEIEDYAGVFRVENAPADALQIEKMSKYVGKWSFNAQVVFKAFVPGARLILPTGGIPGLKSLTLWFTRGPQYGTFRILQGEKVVLESFDGYAPQVTRAEPVALTFPRPTGTDDIIFEIVGRNEASKGYWLGIDCARTGG